ncbi:MAG: gfo/Idh/MocA family oxidoreductase [Phycisphaerales bacterium]|nr:gfo/Idh/MocA family oxidoreductase [Phycisphaerales bacterium]
MPTQSHDAARRHFLKLAGAAGLSAALPVMGEEKNVPLAPPDKQPPNLKVPHAPGKKAGWAIVGLGELALGEIMPAFGQCERSRPVALVSGHPDKARQVAERYGVDSKAIYNYENFDTIRDNAEIDVVYIVLPNHMHAEYTKRALAAGKHVLCEKPMAVNSGECQEMIDTAKSASRKLMIAYRLRYEPYNQSAIEMARRQAYGKIKVFESENIQNVFPPNIRLSKKTGGGPLGDVGVYCINAARYITGEEPAEVFGYAYQPTDIPRFAEVPESVIWTMRFPSGVLAHCSCGFGGEESRRYRVHCAEGWFELDPAFSYRGLRLHVKKGNEREEITLPEKSHFALEMDHFSQCVLEDRRPWTPGEEGLADIRVIEAIERSIQSGRPEKAQARLAARG